MHKPKNFGGFSFAFRPVATLHLTSPPNSPIMLNFFKFTFFFNVTKIFSCIICCSMLVGCMQHNHIFLSPNSPAFQQKGEVKLNGFAGTNHAEGQLAVSATNHFGFAANYYQQYNDKAQGVEIATILYGNASECLGFEFTGGIGYGHISGFFHTSPLQFADATYKFDNAFTYFYFQPAIGARFNKGEISVVSKFSWVKFNHFIEHYEYYYKPYASASKDDDVISYNRKGLTANLVLQYKLKTSENFHLFFQGGGSFSNCTFVSKKNETFYLQYLPWILSVGVQLNLGRKAK
jgi:hypothetical protein